MRTRTRRRWPGAALLMLIGMAMVVATGLVAPASGAARPSAIVGLGDSYLSGEAAGSYAAGTDTADNACHRSTRSLLAQANAAAGAPALADEAINLACSGATTASVRTTGSYGEAAQLAGLRQLLVTRDVVAVIVSVGGNDLGFSTIIRECVTAYLPFVEDCNSAWQARLAGLLATVAPQVGAVLDDVHAALAEAGSSAPVVLLSYPSPVTERLRNPWLRALQGCPFTTADLAWSRTGLTPAISAAWATVAAGHGARFLDLSRALEGHEVCAAGIGVDGEWAKGIFVNTAQIRNGLGTNLVSQSLHPNAAGHAQLGRCLRAFLEQGGGSAQCLADPADGGNLAAVPSAVVALPPPPVTTTTTEPVTTTTATELSTTTTTEPVTTTTAEPVTTTTEPTTTTTTTGSTTTTTGSTTTTAAPGTLQQPPVSSGPSDVGVAAR